MRRCGQCQDERARGHLIADRSRITRSIMMMSKLTTTMSAPPTSTPPAAQRQVLHDPRQRGQPYRITSSGAPFDPRASAPRPTINATARTGPPSRSTSGATCPSVGSAASSNSPDFIKRRERPSCKRQRDSFSKPGKAVRVRGEAGALRSLLNNGPTIRAMTRWSYHVEAMNIPERWWRKKRQADVDPLQSAPQQPRVHGLGARRLRATPMTGVFTQNVKGYAYLALFKQPLPEP